MQVRSYHYLTKAGATPCTLSLYTVRATSGAASRAVSLACSACDFATPYDLYSASSSRRSDCSHRFTSPKNKLRLLAAPAQLA